MALGNQPAGKRAQMACRRHGLHGNPSACLSEGVQHREEGDGDTGLGKDAPHGAHGRSGHVGTDGLAESPSALSHT